MIVTDDLDGTESAKPYRLAWQNTVYDIDLTDELLRALQPYIDAGRRAGRRTADTAYLQG